MNNIFNNITKEDMTKIFNKDIWEITSNPIDVYSNMFNNINSLYGGGEAEIPQIQNMLFFFIIGVICFFITYFIIIIISSFVLYITSLFVDLSEYNNTLKIYIVGFIIYIILYIVFTIKKKIALPFYYIILWPLHLLFIVSWWSVYLLFISLFVGSSLFFAMIGGGLCLIILFCIRHFWLSL